MKEIITSVQNPKIKNIVSLIEKSSERKHQQLIVIEGAREIKLAIASGIEAKVLYYFEDHLKAPQRTLLKDLENRQCKIVEVSKNVFDKIAFRENSDGLLLIAKPNYRQLNELRLSKNPLIIVLEGIEKPGNLGAILRTADAAGVDAVVVCDPKIDFYNPNAIRSSVGCIFTCQLSAASSDEVYQWLKTNNINVYATALTATAYYHTTSLKQSTALVFGTEAHGLSNFWLEQVPSIKIPMQGKIDSLNLSNSVAIMVFEAMRQRNFNV